MLIRHLREATTADHDAVEAAIPLMRADLDVALYRSTLGRMYGVVLPWELMAEQVAVGELRGIVRERSRRSQLANDLLVLGVDARTLPVSQVPTLEGESEILGTMYVMEGSRLGGQLIARHVEQVLGDVGRRSASYLRGFGEETGSMWKQLVARLAVELPERETERAVQAAREMFATFGGWMGGAALTTRTAERAIEMRAE